MTMTTPKLCVSSPTFLHHHLRPPTTTIGFIPKLRSSAATNPQSYLQQQQSKSYSNDIKYLIEVYLEQSKYLTTTSPDGAPAPPRWFSPLDSHSPNSPLLLYLPGILGTGLGLSLHHQRLGQLFDIWCLHIPTTDRTPFLELVKLVESTVKSENDQFPERPIYLVGESFGACLALSVAARNPEIDLVLVLANSATCFNESQLRPLVSLLESMPRQLGVGLHYLLNLVTGMASTIAVETLEKSLPLIQTDAILSQALVGLSSQLPGLTEVLSVEMLLWKLRILDSACSYTNSRLHAVKAQSLILSSGKDLLLPSRHEGERLHRLLPKSDIRIFEDSGHMLLMERDHDLVTILKASSFYRRKRNLDYVFDYLPPSPYEFQKAREQHRFVEAAFSPVMLSTLESGKIVRGLSGIPSEGPVIFVGYHMMLGLELAPLVARIFSERGILVRGIAHPMMFRKLKEGRLPDTSQFDSYRIMGAVPVSASNLFKLLKAKSHILLYPGGMREALHRKGEEYKLFWPEQSEFVRMAARFGAKIVPFGVVGEDDIGELVFDYEDQMKIPFLRTFIQEVTEEAEHLRSDVEGEVANQDIHLPVMRPKLPGRFYYLFGKPIETQGRKQELKKRERAHEVYVEVKKEVESCLSYLQRKRQYDPYRSIISRSLYHLTHGVHSQVPTFEPY